MRESQGACLDQGVPTRITLISAIANCLPETDFQEFDRLVRKTEMAEEMTSIIIDGPTSQNYLTSKPAGSAGAPATGKRLKIQSVLTGSGGRQSGRACEK